MYNYSASLGYILLCFDFLMLLVCKQFAPIIFQLHAHPGLFFIPAPACLGNHTKLTLKCPPYCCSTFGEEEPRQKKLHHNPTRALGAHYYMHVPRPGKQSSQKEAVPPQTVIQALVRDKHQHLDWGMRLSHLF